jgi:hypothetical protein
METLSSAMSRALRGAPWSIQSGQGIELAASKYIQALVFTLVQGS